MGKQPYYVSITQKLIHQDSSESSDYEVHLDEEQLSILQDMLTTMDQEDRYTLQRTPVPYKSADHDDANDEFTVQLKELYQFIYDAGTDDTRSEIRRLRILGKLDHTDYDNKGYENSPLNK
ncbi:MULTISPECIES: hypothetical protein [unclassified Paenibacillus]|uniref:Hydrolase n=1 Tax=Paenibacillus provencensis TaxID=441151 RepID=A0ABW3Q4V4_9BACL|nr:MULTISPECIES: hypothetical protein [unclassified Paenibacillus]MCM3129365.1 hypothetical protein [Paenibacillus sp. MER 78]SFS72130.1 hypothetical protein SAMN04488601_102217 [Paenibacillus sp. 453mf]